MEVFVSGCLSRTGTMECSRLYVELWDRGSQHSLADSVGSFDRSMDSASFGSIFKHLQVTTSLQSP